MLSLGARRKYQKCRSPGIEFLFVFIGSSAHWGSILLDLFKATKCMRASEVIGFLTKPCQNKATLFLMKNRSRIGRCYARGVLVQKSIKINENNALYFRVFLFLRIDRFAYKTSALTSALATIALK